MPGKDPHRPEGKTTDAERMVAPTYSKGLPHQSPSAKEIADINAREQDAHGSATGASEEQVGGSRPGVESRVKEAIQQREAREEDTS